MASVASDFSLTEHPLRYPLAKSPSESGGLADEHDRGLVLGGGALPLAHVTVEHVLDDLVCGGADHLAVVVADSCCVGVRRGQLDDATVQTVPIGPNCPQRGGDLSV